MKKYSVILVTFFLVIILLLAFLAINFFLNQNNSGYSKISWEQPGEGLKDNVIIAPIETIDSVPENIPVKSEKVVEKIAEKPLSSSLAIENYFVSWGFTRSTERTVDTIIIHSSYDALSESPYSIGGLIKEYKQYGVAPHYLIDRKGIIDRVTLNGMTLMNWEVYNLPFDNSYIQNLKPSAIDTTRRGVFFKGDFDLKEVADTYIDMSNYKKGFVWINGHNLGRFWEIGPQKRLYCPAPWLNKGKNVIMVFDMLQNKAETIKGAKTLE